MPHFHLQRTNTPFFVLTLLVKQQENHLACTKPALNIPEVEPNQNWSTALVKCQVGNWKNQATDCLTCPTFYVYKCWKNVSVWLSILGDFPILWLLYTDCIYLMCLFDGLCLISYSVLGPLLSLCMQQTALCWLLSRTYSNCGQSQTFVNGSEVMHSCQLYHVSVSCHTLPSY